MWFCKVKIGPQEATQEVKEILIPKANFTGTS